jgi:hypothetical protein
MVYAAVACAEEWIFIQSRLIPEEGTMSTDNTEPKTKVIAETDNYLAWRADEPDGEITYHLELNNVTLHFFGEEWDEFLRLVKLLD